MAGLQEVRIQGISPSRLAPVIGAERAARFEALARSTRDLLEGHTVMNVSSTAVGGGVAEMLQALLAYVRGAGIDAQWIVIRGSPEFFAITKRVHNGIHGSPGDGGPLGEAEREVYERVLDDNAHEIATLVRERDVVLLHDPQTAGLVARVKQAGAFALWRSHIGCDVPNHWSERAWAFIRPYVESADASIFTREAYAPAWLDRSRLHVIPPSLDPFSPKNAPMSEEQAQQVLSYVGVLGGSGDIEPVVFERRDGTPGRVNRHADVLQTGPPPAADVPLVVQVSRWDRLKDMCGVMRAFAEHSDGSTGAHLLLVGPNVSGVTDDPEGAEVLNECMATWHDLSHADRSRIHLACIPTADVDENAVIVNAIQRHASIVTQKSLAEGFGLTVAEAMWKGRAVIGSRVGGIPDQIVHGESGVLVDPSDLRAFAGEIERLLGDPSELRRLGVNARARAVDRFLGDRHLSQYAALVGSLLAQRT